METMVAMVRDHRMMKCSGCDQEFHSENERRNHINEGLCPSSAPTYDCPHCQRKFFKKVVLKNHIMTHTGERPYNCTVCGQKFRRSHHRKRHMEGVHNVTPKLMRRSKFWRPDSPDCDNNDIKADQEMEMKRQRRTTNNDKNVRNGNNAKDTSSKNGEVDSNRLGNLKTINGVRNKVLKNMKEVCVPGHLGAVARPAETLETVTASQKTQNYEGPPTNSLQNVVNNSQNQEEATFLNSFSKLRSIAPEKQPSYTNNNMLPCAANLNNLNGYNNVGNLGGYITVPPSFGSSKQTSVLNIPLQNVSQMFTVSGNLGNIFPLMSSMINPNVNNQFSLPPNLQQAQPNLSHNVSSQHFGHFGVPTSQENNSNRDSHDNSLIETSVSFPEITSAWSNLIEEDTSPYKCFLCNLKFSSQSDLDGHFQDHIKRGDAVNGQS